MWPRLSRPRHRWPQRVQGGPLYKVHFRFKDTDFELVAESLDLSHPYFVSIKDIRLDFDEGTLVNPHLENTRKRFRGIDNLMIPVQNCALIEQFPWNPQKNKTKMTVLPVSSGNEPAGSD